MGNQTYYKGFRARVEGTLTSKGKFAIRPERVMTIIPPSSLESTALKPYVHLAAAKPAAGARVPDWTGVAGGAKAATGKELR